MNITVSKTGPVSILRLVGHLDPDSQNEVVKFLDDLVKQGDSKIVIDMEQVSSVNSQGFSLLINAQQKARNAGGDIRLSGLQCYVKELFELTRLDTVFGIFPTCEEALSSFS